jgi:DNA-binding CsgD family transcriptional regulator
MAERELQVPGPGDDPQTESLRTRAYLAVLRHPDPSRSLLIAQGMHAEAVDRALATLAAQGLVRLGPGGSIEVVPPDISLPVLASDFERMARQTRSAAHELAQVFFQARHTATAPDPSAIRILGSLDEIGPVTAEMIATGKEGVRCFRSLSPRTQALFASPMHSHEEPTRGAGGVILPLSSVYDTKVLELEGALEVLHAREGGGEVTRFTTSVPFSAVIVDDTAAVVDVSAFDPSGFGSALVRARSLVVALRALYDHLWNLAAPLEPSGPSAARRRDQTTWGLLAAGATDATIARQTGVSQRTVERRVRELMDQVGASTRFQAGVQAARRGLI